MRLRRADCGSPGLGRHRRGRGFEYVDPDGATLRDPATVERIRTLAIPPAWTSVWICPDPQGHLQATGFDAAGRKQYLYHPAWRARRDREKFDRMLEFAEALPRVRRRVARDLARSDLGRERVLGCSVRLIDLGFFRIGGEDYADANGTYGLATLRKTHVSLGPRPAMAFDFVAKGRQRQRRVVSDDATYDVVGALRNRRAGGPELLAYRRGRAWVDVRSGDVNEYLREAAGDDFTAKDFRTWNATTLAALSLAVLGNGGTTSATARKRAIAVAVRDVARYLGNTPTVCRNSYIDPRVFDRFRAGVTVGGVVDLIGEPTNDVALRRRLDRAVLDLLQGDFASAAIERSGGLDLAA
jgi:DNA topoisomerase IB